MNDVSNFLYLLEQRAIWVVASNGKRVLKDDLELYEHLLTLCNSKEHLNENEVVKDIDFDETIDNLYSGSLDDIINEINNKIEKYENNNLETSFQDNINKELNVIGENVNKTYYNKMKFVSVEDVADPFDLSFDENFFKVTDIEKFDFDKHDKGKKFYINSWLIDQNNKTTYSDTYKQIMFKMIQFLAFYKNRDDELNSNFINKIENMINDSELLIEEKRQLFDTLGSLSKLIED